MWKADILGPPGSFFARADGMHSFRRDLHNALGLCLDVHNAPFAKLLFSPLALMSWPGGWPSLGRSSSLSK